MPVPPTAPFKQMLLSALQAPIVKHYTNKETAHRDRFAMYNTLARLRRQGDAFGDMKDVLEFVIQPGVSGGYDLLIQEKTTRLANLLGGWKSLGGEHAAPTMTAHVDVQALQVQVNNETAKEIDPTNPEDALLLQQADIAAWMNELDERLPSDKARQALILRQQAGPTATLDEVKALLSSHGIN